MKAVLMSIQPKWCELIASGKKTVEVRKSKPKLETPFKVYIYCTKDRTLLTNGGGCAFIDKPYRNNGENLYNSCWYVGNGKVIGEFVCNHITEIEILSKGLWTGGQPNGHCVSVVKRSALSPLEIIEYANGKKYVYGWHISNLVIYDKPKELNEFKKINRECCYADLGLAKRDCPECNNKNCFVQRPPQSWFYVEEL